MAAAVTTRRPALDRLRGLAVLLMVLDHVLVQVEPFGLARHTLTRLSLPFFMFAAAAVWRPGDGLGRSRRTRLLRLLCVAAEAIFNGALHLGWPGPVMLLLLAVCLCEIVPGPVPHRALVLTTLGLIQALYLPLGVTGYQPGVVVAWFGIGLLATSAGVEWGGKLPGYLERVGRRPCEWYVGHLAVLAVAVTVLR